MRTLQQTVVFILGLSLAALPLAGADEIDSKINNKINSGILKQVALETKTGKGPSSVSKKSAPKKSESHLATRGPVGATSAVASAKPPTGKDTLLQHTKKQLRQTPARPAKPRH